jgi:hypothetical protein
MDRVRLGRALGYGARHAAKTLTSAVDAATSPNPNPTPKTARAHPVVQVVETVRQVSQAKAHAKTAAKKSLLAPVKQFSSVVMLQVTGTFFALFTMVMGDAVWRHHNDFLGAAGAGNTVKVYASLLLGLVFAYYTVSNFVKAARREKRDSPRHG